MIITGENVHTHVKPFAYTQRLSWFMTSEARKCVFKNSCKICWSKKIKVPYDNLYILRKCVQEYVQFVIKYILYLYIPQSIRQTPPLSLSKVQTLSLCSQQTTNNHTIDVRVNQLSVLICISSLLFHINFVPNQLRHFLEMYFSLWRTPYRNCGLSRF